MVKKAMIMAAGAGTRLDPLTQIIPKPMVPVANKPIMELILRHLGKFGIKDVIANTHTLAETIHARFKHNNGLNINFNYVYEKELSGTAGGVKKCESFFESDETFIVISGDALTDVNIDELVKNHKSTGAIATMALKEVPYEEVQHFGVVVVDKNSRVVGFQEKPSIEEARSNLVNTGIYIFEADIFKYIPENTFYDFAKNVFPSLMANNELLCAFTIQNYWNDIGTLNQYRLSSYDVLNSKVLIDHPYRESEFGWLAGSCMISPDAILSGKLFMGENSIIEKSVRTYGNSIIGNNCIIKEGARIRNAIIWDNVVIEEDAKIDGAIIANNARIGKGSILAPGSVIPDNCVISPYQMVTENIKFQSGDKYNSQDVET